MRIVLKDGTELVVIDRILFETWYGEVEWEPINEILSIGGKYGTTDASIWQVANDNGMHAHFKHWMFV